MNLDFYMEIMLSEDFEHFLYLVEELPEYLDYNLADELVDDLNNQNCDEFIKKLEQLTPITRSLVDNFKGLFLDYQLI